MIKKVRVLIVDDSAIARSMIRDGLERDPHIEVVGLASDPYIARDLILELDPDVITLDMEMPRMDGLSFLKILQEHHPIPVVVISALTPAGSQLALAALAAGAIDVVKKPDTAEAVAQTARRLITQIKAAAQSRRITQPLPADPSSRSLPDAWRQASTAERLILLGGSTGGVEALRFLLPRLPPGLPNPGRPPKPEGRDGGGGGCSGSEAIPAG